MFDQSLLQRVGAVCGFAVPCVAFGCIWAAILFFPGFSWFYNALSDLGVASGLSAPLFNFGLVVSGLLCFLFAVTGLFNYFRNDVVGRSGSVIFAAAAVWLAAIGVFNANFWPAHFIAAVLFFVTLPVAFLVMTAALYRRQEVKLAVFTLVSSFAAAAPWIFYLVLRYAPNVAIPETISGLIGSFWIVVLSYRALKTAKL